MARLRNSGFPSFSPKKAPFWMALAVAIAALLYLSTVQTIINGGGHPYVTDVGEHQNALPRWGTIHHSGYPQWTCLLYTSPSPRDRTRSRMPSSA